MPPDAANAGDADSGGGTNFHPAWLVPDWPAPSNVRAFFTTRQGGVSQAPFDSLNLGDHVADRPADVAANRLLLQQAIGVPTVFLQQVHGCDVLALEPSTRQGLSADASVSTRQGLACTVMVADCLPVLLCTASGSVVAAAHAGWRGLAGQDGHGVLESVYASFVAAGRMDTTQAAIETIAWLGPCIGPQAFEVGAEVRAAFVASQPAASDCFEAVAGGKYLANLSALARLRLAALGVTRVYGNDGSPPWCTVGNSRQFYSHRRDVGTTAGASTGRMAACIWRV